MCSAMNSLEIFRPYNMKRSKPFFINESQQSDKFNTDYIPYLSEPFDEKPIVELNDILYFQYNNNNNNNNKMETNDNNELNLNAFDNWGDMTEDDVVGFQDDNVSHVDSDYSEHPTTEQDNLYAQSNPLDVAYGSSGGEISDSEVKCNPTEYILRPPSGSVMHLSYNIPVMPIQNEPTSSAAAEIMRRKAAMMNNTKIPHAMYGSQQDMDGNNSLPAAAPAASTSNYPTDAHSNPGCFHPNMWYPNASFGSYSSYGSNHAYGRQYGPQISHDHMVDMFQLSNSGREARNRAEKNRRDKLNSSIQELSTMVPHVAESPRRVDKTAVLRFAAHGLRLKYVFGKSLNNEPTRSTDALMKLLDSFFLTLTCNGHIVLVSSSIEQHLGHCQTDLYGQNILHITHPDDHQMLKEKLIPTNLDNLLDIQPEDESGEPRQRTQAEEDEIDRRLQEDKRNFTIRLARSGPRSEPTAYELVKIDGSFRRSDNAPRGLKTSTFPSTIQLMRRSRGREDIMPLHTISGNDIVLIAIARIVRPPAITPLKEVNSFEYKSRHLIDGRIIDCDKRIGLVAGYMLDEVLNLSPFTFIHQDDVPWVIVALRQMYDCNNSSSGESAYRLFARTGKFIYLHSKGFLEIDKNTNRVHSFICINTLLSEEEGKRHIEKMKKKFSVVIDTQIPKSINDAPASENPQQLEKSVLCLIQDLKSELDNNNDVEASTSTSTSFSQQSPHYNNSNPYSTSTLPQMPDLSGIDRPTNPPPLAIVPPATDSVQNSITENVSAVNTTTERYLGSNTNSYQQQHQLSAPEGHCRNESSQNPIASIDLHHNCRPDQETERHTYTPIGTVKRKLSLNSEINDADEYKVPIQRQAIESVLSDSLTRINNRLNRQLNAAIELRDQSQTYEVPHTEERIANIMQEHQAQQEMYEHINNEFQVHRECSEISGSNSDSELIRGNNGNSLEQIQQQQQQQQQQNSNVSVPIATEVTATTLSSSNASDSDAQLCPNNNDNNNSEL